MFSSLEDIYKKPIYTDQRIMLPYFWKCIINTRDYVYQFLLRGGFSTIATTLDKVRNGEIWGTVLCLKVFQVTYGSFPESTSDVQAIAAISLRYGPSLSKFNR